MTPLHPTEPQDDAERDAHLQGALRHAPDANVAPPAALSDAILRAAHAAVAQTRRASPTSPGWHPLAAAWAWLGQPRLAGALAGLMVATLVGVLWWGQPIERAVEPAPQAPLRPNDSAPAEPVVAKSKLARPLQKSEAKAPERVLVESAPAPAPAPAPTPTPARGEAAPEAPAAAAAEARQAGAVVAQAAPALDAATAESPAVPVSATPAPVAPARRADASARQRAALSDAGAQALAAKSGGAALASLADLRAAIAARPGRWSWQVGTHAPRAMTDEVQAWLARLDAAAGAASAGAAPSSSGAADKTGATLHLLRDSQPYCSVHWSVDAVQMAVVGSAQVWQRAGLAPEIARALDVELAQIAPR